ncbi:hypothetical protein MNB_SM-7-1091 [hydrothermal vent metagenome]|uniref:Uncharacterized protein n=1 Tax=hydrothermal vent metagenome TaxID=652676 RepID=A0A1W1BAE7_9ZZZZ
MSLKESVEFIKEELNSEEKLFEKAVQTERFLKKYKKGIIAIIAAVVILALGNTAYKIKEKNRIEEANLQLELLVKDPTNQQAQNRLKELSPKLYTAWSFSYALKSNDLKKLLELKGSKLPLIGDLSTYEVASRKADQKELVNYEMRQDAIYKDLAIVQDGILYLKENKIKKAKEKFLLIDKESPAYGIATILNHYGVK